MYTLNKLFAALSGAAVLALSCHVAMAAPAAMVDICPGQQADNSGAVPASAALQACIAAAGAGGTLELPPGTYLLDKQLAITFPFTLRTKGLQGSSATCTLDTPCATLKAAPEFSDRYGLIAVGTDDSQVRHVNLDHIALDGNRIARLKGHAHAQCLTGGHGNSWGFNARMKNCTECTLTYSSSSNTLCGTAMEWWGDGATIAHNAFLNNGNRHLVHEWADGLSMHLSNHSTVRGNRFVDNSDVALISFGAHHTMFENNTIHQVKMPAFAGLMLDSLDTGDFTDSVVTGNVIDCAPGMCDFAVNIGPRPWYPDNQAVFGGKVTGNTIRGGTLGMNIAGVKAGGQPMEIAGNKFEGKWSRQPVTCFKAVRAVLSTPLSRDPKHAAIKLGRNYLNRVPLEPHNQSTDHCIN